jgi:hypothetical protein
MTKKVERPSIAKFRSTDGTYGVIDNDRQNSAALTWCLVDNDRQIPQH